MRDPDQKRWRARPRRRGRRLAAGVCLALVLAVAVPLLAGGLKLRAGAVESLRSAASDARQFASSRASSMYARAGGSPGGDASGSGSPASASSKDDPGDSKPETADQRERTERPIEPAPSPAAAAYAAVAPELPGLEPEDVGGTFQSTEDPAWALVRLEAPNRDGYYAVYVERTGDGWKARRSVLANRPDYPKKGRAALVGLPEDLQKALYPEQTPEPALSPQEEAREFVSESPYFGEGWKPVSLQTSGGFAKVRVEGPGSSYTHAYLRREAGSWTVAGLGQALTAAELPEFPGGLVKDGELPDAGPATVPVPEPVLEGVPDERREEVKEGLEEVRGTVEDYDGVAGVYVRRPGEEGGYGIRPDERFYAASVIKVPVMAAVFQRVEEGKLSLSDTVKTTERDYAGGAGWLQWQEPGASHTIGDYLWMMITRSDNVATNVLVRAVGGPEYVNSVARELGAENTRLQHKVTDQRAATPALDNYTTPRDMADILAAIASGEAASEAHTEHMLDLLRQNEEESWATESLPPGTETACKGGWLDGVYNDVCLVSGEKAEPYIISIFSKYGPPQVGKGAALNAEISSEVWEIQTKEKEEKE